MKFDAKPLLYSRCRFFLRSQRKGYVISPYKLAGATGGGIRTGACSVLAVDAQAAFKFYEYFDWSPYGDIDLPYVRAHVAALPSQPSLQGAMVLIKHIHGRFCSTG